MGVMYNPFSLEGKTILVTGASSGIGQAIAIECSKMGATLVITARNEDRLNDTLKRLDAPNRGHIKLLADLNSEEEIVKLVKILPKLDGVVLCAGRGNTLPVQFSTQEKLDNIFSINFYSPAILLANLYKKKIIKNESSTVLISSIGGNYRYSPGNSIYGASKAALSSFTKFSAIEFGARKIRVNAICPGMVETPLINKGTLTDEDKEKDMAKYPLKRYGKPEDIAYLAVYLLSDAASWVTGQDFIIDGGISAK